MLLGGLELGLGLRLGDPRFIHLALRQRALLEHSWRLSSTFLAASVVSRAAFHVGLRFDHRFGNGGVGGGAQIGFGLLEPRLALGGLGGEVAALEHGQKLALLHVVAAVDLELLHRRGDLGHTLAWSRGNSAPSPATTRRMVAWVTAVTCTGPAPRFPFPPSSSRPASAARLRRARRRQWDRPSFFVVCQASSASATDHEKRWSVPPRRHGVRHGWSLWVDAQ